MDTLNLFLMTSSILHLYLCTFRYFTFWYTSKELKFRIWWKTMMKRRHFKKISVYDDNIMVFADIIILAHSIINYYYLYWKTSSILTTILYTQTTTLSIQTTVLFIPTKILSISTVTLAKYSVSGLLFGLSTRVHLDYYN